MGEKEFEDLDDLMDESFTAGYDDADLDIAYVACADDEFNDSLEVIDFKY